MDELVNRSIGSDSYINYKGDKSLPTRKVWHMKKIIALVAIVIMAVSMVPAHAQKEVLLRAACVDEPKTLNIWKATDVWSTHAVAWFYPSLYYRKPVTLEPLPDLCTLTLDELKAKSPDGLTFTFPLRDDVAWDDGTPVTAHDFEFAYDFIVELELSNYLPMYEDVASVKAKDDYTLEIKLKKCTPQFEENIIFHFAVPVPQFESMFKSRKLTEVSRPVSAGPFSFGEWRKGSFVKLVTNPNYYGKGRTVKVKGIGDIVEGPRYDGLLLKFYGSTDDAVQAIKDGEVDFIWTNLDEKYIDSLKDSKDVAIKKADELGFYYLAPNVQKKPFDDLVLRQALVYLVDKKAIVDKLLHGYGGVAHSVVMPSAGEWYNPNVNKFGSGMAMKDRISKAREMLTAAGYKVPDTAYPGDVIKLPDGTPMKPFEILTPPADYDPVRAEAGVMIQNWWREIGVPVTTRHTSFEEIIHATFETMDFDWYIMGWRIGGSGYPDYLWYNFHSDQAVPDGNNPMGYKNPKVDKYLDDLMALCDREELIDAAWEAQKIIVDEVAYCSLYYRTLNEAHQTDTFEGWFTQLGGIAGTETPRSCLLYLGPPGTLPPTPPPTTAPPTAPPTTAPPTAPPTTAPPTAPPTTAPPTAPPTTAPPTAPPTTAPPGGPCLGTALLASMLAAAAVFRRKRK